MANNPHDLTPIGLRERPVSADFNQSQSQIYLTMRELLRASMMGRASDSSAAGQSRSGFLADGFRVVPLSPTALTVQVTPGHGFVYDGADIPTGIGMDDIEGLSDLSPFKAVCIMSPIQFAVPALPSNPNSRIDIIEVRCDRRLDNAIVSSQLNQSTRTYGPKSYYKTLDFTLDGRTGYTTALLQSTAGISYKSGVAAASPTAPVVSTGYVKIAEVHVAYTDTVAAAINIGDYRPILCPGNVLPISASWKLEWNSGSPTATVLSICAPPGVQMGMACSGSNRGSGIVFVTGGAFREATLSLRNAAFEPSTISATNEFIHLTQGMQVKTLTSSDSAAQVLCPSAYGVPLLKALFGSFWQSLDVTNRTDTSLETMVITATGHLSY